MRRRNRWITIIACAVIGACSRTDDSRKLVITGSSTVAPLVSDIAKRFEAIHPDVRIDIQTGGTSRGIADVRSGLADLGMVSRALKKGEEDLVPRRIAMDGVGVIVHAENPVRELSDEQVVAIYRGSIRNWKEVGGDDATIVVVNKAEGRSTLESFTQHFGIAPSEIRADVVIGENEHGIKTVAGSTGAIGYVSIGSAESAILSRTPIRLLPCAGVAAESARVADGTFPLSRPLNLVHRGAPTALASEFLDFAVSAESRELVKSHFLVPLSD